MIFATKAFRPRGGIPPIDAYPNLRKVVAEMNLRRRNFARPEIMLDALTVQNAEAIRLHVEIERRPDVLFWEGQGSHAEAQARDIVLRKAGAELEDFLHHRLAI